MLQRTDDPFSFSEEVSYFASFLCYGFGRRMYYLLRRFSAVRFGPRNPFAPDGLMPDPDLILEAIQLPFQTTP